MTTGKDTTRVVAALTLAACVAGASALGFAMKATDQPAFCGSCHVMAEAVRTHKASVHAKQACNECHAPENLAGKVPFKAATGTNDVFVNTFGRIKDAVHADKNMKDTVQKNCLRCHSSTTMNVNLEVKQYCADCHRQVPHMNKMPMSKRTVAYE